ncbi:hypothetical protein MP228_012668 [Amoeboaphelidium protococcarum]|nr:hypothetical protein MP228_012668 [Amoeboaphelidium protococcarum]
MAQNQAVTQIKGASASLWSSYVKSTTLKTRMIDAYLATVMAHGVLIFMYGLLTSAYPYNSFLAAFGCSVGQFVFTVNLRMKTQSQNVAQLDSFGEPVNKKVSSARLYGLPADEIIPFAEFISCHLLLYIFVVNFLG